MTSLVSVPEALPTTGVDAERDQNAKCVLVRIFVAVRPLCVRPKATRAGPLPHQAEHWRVMPGAGEVGAGPGDVLVLTRHQDLGPGWPGPGEDPLDLTRQRPGTRTPNS